MTMKSAPFSVWPTSMTSMTFGCWTRPLILPSIKKRLDASGLLLTLSSKNFTAHWRSVKTLVAAHTEAMPPCPSSRLKRYFPATTWPDSYPMAPLDLLSHQKQMAIIVENGRAHYDALDQTRVCVRPPSTTRV
jgi:hypothetical protein